MKTKGEKEKGNVVGRLLTHDRTVETHDQSAYLRLGMAEYLGL